VLARGGEALIAAGKGAVEGAESVSWAFKYWPVLALAAGAAYILILAPIPRRK
jgi:hypothetical protein